MTLYRNALAGALLVAVGACPAIAQQTVTNEFFESRIRPVLAARCYACHNSKMKEPKGYLTLDTREGVMKGGTLGPALVPGKPGDSKLLHAMKYADPHLQMPPSGKLADEVIADFEAWIAGGAPDPRAGDTAGAVAKRRVVDDAEVQKGRQWWAFQAVQALPLPVSAHASMARTTLDHFVYARLGDKGLTPSTQADDRTLIRRAYIDLIGLKPTYDEVEAYANDASPTKYEKLIDKLLTMPQYGERWGRHWLDVVRYGEDNPGNITNPPYPHAWRYRDWVIEALNKDVPYDRFVKLQLAADLIPGTSRPDMRALGPIALGPQDHKDVRLSIDVIGTLQLNDWDERLDTLTRGLLGLSVACARCHDHKFDPIRQMDYARLSSVFASTSRALRPFFEIDPKTEMRFMWIYQRMFDLHYTANLLESDPGSKPQQAEAQVKKFRQELKELQAEIDAMSKEYPQIAAYIKTVPYPGEKPPDQRNPDGTLKKREVVPDEKRARPADQIPNPERVQNQGGGAGPLKRIDPQAPFLNSIFDAGVWWNTSESDLTFFDVTPGKPRDLPVYRGGNLGTPTDPAPRGFPLVLAKDAGDFRNGSGRLELGEKIFTDAAPLSARVMVNRVWGWHFDKHLVGTPSDFGIQGLAPTHPELLDDLSAGFIASGWSLKWLHREIMLSATYRQSSTPRTREMEADPTNQLLWRMNPRRMDIEAYRDSLLQASGKLDLAMYGPSQPDVDEGVRRTVYASISRGRSNDVMRLYDVPAPLAHIPMRQPTLNPLQALFVLNSSFVQEQAKALAAQIAADATPDAIVQSLYRKVFSRNATPDEIALGIRYLGSADTVHYAQALLSTNEVIFWP
ncbi:MAG: PSD1 and planctomycete cytochrome C domain-containing protein [Vicinamibacterales bacterium]